MAAADLIVIAAYALGILAIGRHYARRSTTADEYLLGGRAMNPLMVGISLFASLTSTLSYLMLPGEMIRYGPMIFAQLLSYPIAALLVGWLIIPAFMKQRATSAYELLEFKLGRGGRLLGAGMFVVLRLIWMSAILFATAEKVVIPFFGLSPSATPYACIALGAITIAYTALGGLRAVIVTDALQSLIMLVGALVCIVVVAVKMGSWDSWWPSAWYPHWDQPVFWDTSAAHIPMGNAVIYMLVWMTCTAGADQMAVQRYLATRDVRAARSSFAVSLISDAIVQILLAATGLAVLAYFLRFAGSGADQASLLHSADELFPRFIADVLPAGLTGLLIAAILSAAMSSTSAGINSCSAVIVTDFISSKNRREASGSENVSAARRTAVGVGALAIAISILLGQYPGNLLERCFTVVNLLSAPLFVLFALALFVPWATPLGAYCATIASVTVSAGIAFRHWFGLNFLWMGACSLVAGLLVGMLCSVIPLRRSEPRSIMGSQQKTEF